LRTLTNALDDIEEEPSPAVLRVAARQHPERGRSVAVDPGPPL
jgi:hypothetical protein